MVKEQAITIFAPMLYVILAPVLGGIMAGIDRKITARLQGRKGPSIFQPIWDVLKLFNKETKTINRVQILYLLSFLFFIVFTGILFFAGYDLLLVFFTLTTANIFLVIAAASGHSPYATMGANRELIQMLSYEPMVLIAAIGFYVVTGSFKVSEILESTKTLPIVYLPGVFLGFVFILIIKLRKHPFDISTSHHAHQEMVKGITTEFNGQMFAIVEISHWYENVFLVGVLSLFFINAQKWSIPVAIIATTVCYFVIIVVDNTNARMKWRTMLDNSWVVTAVLGALNLIVVQAIMKVVY